MRKLFSKLTPKTSNSKKERADSALSNDTAVNSVSVVTQSNDASDQDLPRLHQAAWSGNLSKIKQHAKDNPNNLDKNGRTPLHLACAQGHLQVVKALLQRNASTNIQDSEGKTPLIKAVQASRDPCIECLLQYGCNTNLADNQGFTALHYAATAGANATAQILLDKGSNVNQQDKIGRTPLHIACEQKQVATCQILLEREADGNILDQQLKTPFMVASEVGAADVAAVLKKHGAGVVNKSRQGGTTPESASTPQVTQAPRPAAHYSAARSSSHNANESSPELTGRMSRRSSALMQSSPGATSKQSQLKDPNNEKNSSSIIGTGSGRESIAGFQQTNSDDEDRNSWCSSDDGTKQVLQKKQPKKLNLVKMLENYGNDGKIANTDKALAVGGLEAAGWSAVDTGSARAKDGLQVQLPKTTENSTGPQRKASAAANAPNQDSSWDSDTMSASPSPRPGKKLEKAASPEKGSWSSNPASKNDDKTAAPATAETVPIAQQPSAPLMTSTDGEDSEGWDTDATSNPDSPRRLQKTTSAKPNMKGSESDWDSEEEMPSATPRNLKTAVSPLALAPVVDSKSAARTQDGCANEISATAASVRTEEGMSQVRMTAATQVADRHLPEIPESQPFKLPSSSPLEHDRSSSDCKCIEFSAELHRSKKLLQDALEEKQILSNKLDGVQIEKKELVSTLNVVKQQKEVLENSFRELESKLDSARSKIAEVEDSRLILQSSVEKLQGELFLKTEQHARDFLEERNLAKQKLEECNSEMERMRRHITQLERAKQAVPALATLDLEQSNRRLVDENALLSSELLEANNIIGELRSAVSRFEARSVEEKLKLEALNTDLSLVKSERDQLLLQSQARDQLHLAKISDLLEQTSSSAAEKDLALANTRQKYEDEISTLKAEALRSEARLQEEQRARSLLEAKVEDAREQFKNAEDEVQLAAEAQKTMERVRLQDVQLLQQMLDSKVHDLKELTEKYEALRTLQSNTSRDLREAQEKILSQAAVLTERMSVVVELRASLLDQSHRIDNMERETASDKKKLATTQAKLELLQDELQRLRQRKLISAGQSATGSRNRKAFEVETRTHLQPRSPTSTHLKELLTRAEDEITSKDRQIEELHTRLSDASSTKDETLQQVHELEARLRSTESLLASERSGNEALRAHLTACMEHGHRMQSFLRGSQIVANKPMAAEKESRLGDEMLSNAYSTDLASDGPVVTKVAATLERKLRQESRRCAELSQHNTEMRAKLKLVKLYLKEMAVHQSLLQGDRLSASNTAPVFGNGR